MGVMRGGGGGGGGVDRKIRGLSHTHSLFSSCLFLRLSKGSSWIPVAHPRETTVYIVMTKTGELKKIIIIANFVVFVVIFHLHFLSLLRQAA